MLFLFYRLDSFRPKEKATDKSIGGWPIRIHKLYKSDFNTIIRSRTHTGGENAINQMKIPLKLKFNYKTCCRQFLCYTPPPPPPPPAAGCLAFHLVCSFFALSLCLFDNFFSSMSSQLTHQTPRFRPNANNLHKLSINIYCPALQSCAID